MVVVEDKDGWKLTPERPGREASRAEHRVEPVFQRLVLHDVVVPGWHGLVRRADGVGFGTWVVRRDGVDLAIASHRY